MRKARPERFRVALWDDPAGATVQNLMAAPYKRVIVMHVTIIFGGWLTMMLKTPAPALALLILLKIAADMRAHTREHAVPG